MRERSYTASVTQEDPVRYWKDLTANYRQMSDGELLQLSENPEELTEIARQVLRDEMKLRKLETGRSPVTGRLPDPVPRRQVDLVSGNPLYLREDSSDTAAVDDVQFPPHEYTWKTWLCDCESNQHAWQVSALLTRNGIESWVRAVPPQSMDTVGPQVEVAADQLEQARALIAQPIPQDIIDDVNAEVPEFEVPDCPRCGTKDEVMLESAVPVNSWICEACGAEWSDPQAPPEEDAD